MANGIYTNHEIVDSLLIDLNNALKDAVCGQLLQFCCHITQMSQKIVNLRDTVDNDIKNRDDTIKILKKELRNAGHTVDDMTPQEFIEKFMAKEGECKGVDA